MKTIWLAIGCVLSLTATAVADDKLARDSASLKHLLTEIQGVLPDGWRAEITPEVPHEIVDSTRFGFRDEPNLLIWREEKVLGHYMGMNPPPPSENPEADEEPQTLRFDLALMNYLTPAQYEKAAKENESRQKLRSDFQQKMEASGIEWPRVVPPVRIEHFKPQNSEQQELVRQYALLLMRTEPVELPTHYYQTLSMSADFEDYLALQDPQMVAERDGVRKAVLEIIAPYAKKSAAKNDEP